MQCCRQDTGGCLRVKVLRCKGVWMQLSDGVCLCVCVCVYACCVFGDVKGMERLMLNDFLSSGCQTQPTSGG